jgi:hypothetical protein
MRKLTLLSRQDNEKSLTSLQKSKITFTKPASPKAAEEYDEIGRKARTLMAGKIYSEDLLQRVDKALAEYRAAHGGKK